VAQNDHFKQLSMNKGGEGQMETEIKGEIGKEKASKERKQTI
jgi:hypothetical protein